LEQWRLWRLPDIKAKFSFARFLIRAVAMEAIVRKNRPDISIVSDDFRSCDRKCQADPKKIRAASGKQTSQFF
jgi:hypothetical protein